MLDSITCIELRSKEKKFSFIKLCIFIEEYIDKDQNKDFFCYKIYLKIN